MDRFKTPFLKREVGVFCCLRVNLWIIRASSPVDLLLALTPHFKQVLLAKRLRRAL
jgi:hypothetical protein